MGEEKRLKPVLQKKWVGIFLFVWILTLAPSFCLAMDPISDQEMDRIVGQSGVSIEIVDVSLDLNIKNIAWGDTDCGTVILSTLAHTHEAGYFHLNDFNIKNLYIDMDSDASGWVSDDGGSHLEFAAHPLTIDVMRFSSNGPHCPIQALRGRSAIVVGIPDIYVAAEELPWPLNPAIWPPVGTYLVAIAQIPGILVLEDNYLDDDPHKVDATYQDNQKWDYTVPNLDSSKHLFDMSTTGVQFTFHAYVGGYETANFGPNPVIRPIRPNHRATVAITTH